MSGVRTREACGQPFFMSEEEFLLAVYLILFEPEFAEQVLGVSLKKDGTRYIFNVITKNGKYIEPNVEFSSTGGFWFWRVRDLYREDDWFKDSVFVYIIKK